MSGSPVSMSSLAELVDEVERRLSESAERELTTTVIGEMLMERLRHLDKIAYVRFASVYRDFQDVEAFFDELESLMRQKRN
jgi:transcriptional repressor NrdR